MATTKTFPKKKTAVKTGVLNTATTQNNNTRHT